MPEDNEEYQAKFPKDFMWGASTAAHQVEGGTYNQWTEWEYKNAETLAKTAKKRLNWLPNWKQVEKFASDKNNYISGRGVEHYERFKEDFDIAKSLNLNALRFSIEWSRLEPEEGKWDKTEIEHYHTYIKELKKRGIEPILNIWHWTHPVWFEQMGAFEKRSNLRYFKRFVNKISHEYGHHLNFAITMNEPNVYTLSSYFEKDLNSGLMWPPADKGFIHAVKVYLNLLAAHKAAYRLLKRAHPHLQVGVAHQLANIQAKNPHDLLDETSTKFMRYAWNWWFFNRIRRYQDFIGMNYYFTDYYNDWLQKKSPKLPLNDLGWYMEPEGLYPILLRAWSHYKKPIIITENGVPDAHDEYRRWWIEESIVAMERAISEGVQIKGYFHWSLLDNFEWAMGWWPKFGLVAVDREHGMKRTVRDSAKWFAEFIAKQRS